MRRSRFSEEQIISVLKEHEAGMKPADVCRKHGVSDATLYKWRAKYGGMTASETARLRTLEEENRRLKKLLAEQMLDNAVLKDLLVIATTDGTHPVGHLAWAAAADQVDQVKRDPRGIYLPEVDGLAYKTPPLLDAMDPGGIYMPGIGRVHPRTSGLVDVMEAAGEVPSNARIETIDETMRELVARGILDRFDAVHFLFAHGQQSSLLNWCDPTRFNLTVTGAPVFTANAGWSGATGTLNSITPADPNIDRYSLNDASIFLAPTVAGTGNNVVEATGASPLSTLLRHGGSKIFRINDSSSADTFNSGAASFLSIERSPGNVKRGYVDLVLSKDAATAASGLAAVPLLIRTLNTCVPSFVAVGSSFFGADDMRADLKGILESYRRRSPQRLHKSRKFNHRSQGYPCNHSDFLRVNRFAMRFLGPHRKRVAQSRHPSRNNMEGICSGGLRNLLETRPCIRLWSA